MPTTQCPGPWITSSASNEDGNCVEMSCRGVEVHVRDSKNPTGPRLRFTAEMWDRFVAAAASGRIERAALSAAPDWIGASREGRVGPGAANMAGDVGLRDCANPKGPVLIFTPAEWDAFVIGARRGEMRSVCTALAS